MGFWPVVLNVLRNSDVVLMLVDARMPEVGRNSEIVRKVDSMGKKLVYVFNKIDLVGRKDVEELKRFYPDGFFISATRKVGVRELKLFLEKMADGWGRSSLRVGVVGYPNVGKSSLINLLAVGARAKVSSVAGTTRKTQWVRVGRLRIMDSPGVIPFGDGRIQVGMTASKDAHKIKNPEKVAIFLLGESERVRLAIKNFYGVDGESVDDVFEAIGRKRGYLVKGGEVDENRTAVKIIDDWQKGKIRLK
ncbi:MAG: GTPase [archaeon]